MEGVVFADTSGLIALWDDRDAGHARAQTAAAAIFQGRRSFLTTNYVFGEAFLDSRLIRRLPVDAAIESEAWLLFKKCADQPLSFTDATSIAVMKRHSIAEVLSFDADFRRFGLLLIP